MWDVLTERLVDFLLYVLISIVKIMDVENVHGDWNVELSELSDAGRGADQTQIAWPPRGGGRADFGRRYSEQGRSARTPTARRVLLAVHGRHALLSNIAYQTLV